MRNIDSNASSTQQHNLGQLGSHFESQSEASKKRERSSDSSRLTLAEAKPNRSKRLRNTESETDVLTTLEFACPFNKWDRHKYGGKMSCVIYSSRDVHTMIRVSLRSSFSFY